jgi:SAM-dependent methyltransferase
VRPGENILDIGCGCGETSIDLGHRVAPYGRVLGIDISGPMLERARYSVGVLGLANVSFENADAQTHPFPDGAFNLVFSRFGVMFFIDPTAAFANLRRTLKKGGRLAFVCWQDIRLNPWMLVPLMAAAQHIALPTPPAPDAPGPFALADPDRVRRIVEGAGFLDVNLESVKTELVIGGTEDMDVAVNFLMRIGPAATALREAAPEIMPQVAESIHDALVPYFQHGRGVTMEAAAWVVSGRV